MNQTGEPTGIKINIIIETKLSNAGPIVIIKWHQVLTASQVLQMARDGGVLLTFLL